MQPQGFSVRSHKLAVPCSGLPSRALRNQTRSPYDVYQTCLYLPLISPRGEQVHDSVMASLEGAWSVLSSAAKSTPFSVQRVPAKSDCSLYQENATCPAFSRTEELLWCYSLSYQNTRM
eukprot:449821-Rhodomonas_salina.1